jgi:hypothetical protein
MLNKNEKITGIQERMNNRALLKKNGIQPE